MMNIKNYVENRRRMIITIFVLIDLKKEIKENIVFVMKAKKYILKQHLKQNLFENTDTYNYMCEYFKIYTIIRVIIPDYT